jgi:hypothetical protein
LAQKMNILPKLFIAINLIHTICCANQTLTSKFIGNAKRAVSSTNNNRISKLRLILLSDLKQNEIVSMRNNECTAIADINDDEFCDIF